MALEKHIKVLRFAKIISKRHQGCPDDPNDCDAIECVCDKIGREMLREVEKIHREESQVH